jgi:hypothetical protein
MFKHRNKLIAAAGTAATAAVIAVTGIGGRERRRRRTGGDHRDRPAGRA